MKTRRNPWDDDYQYRGRLWGGISPAVPVPPGSSRILELGCGNGKTTASLVQAGYSVTAIDFSSYAAGLCRKTCSDPDRAGILVADIRTIPFRDGSFDVIIASHVTGHLSLSGRRQLTAEIYRLLRCGGTFCFRDFSAEDFRFGKGEETEPGTFMKKNGILTHYFTEEEVAALFTGLSVKSLVQNRWKMQIRGRCLPRAEIVAEFIKSA